VLATVAIRWAYTINQRRLQDGRLMAAPNTKKKVYVTLPRNVKSIDGTNRRRRSLHVSCSRRRCRGVPSNNKLRAFR